MPVRAPWAWRRSPAAQRRTGQPQGVDVAGDHRRGAVAAVLAGGAATAVDLVLADPPYDVGAASTASISAAPTS
ncbi:hypothetical protein MAHJHV35_46470 [Mycobacterium avium subsp. hominissuis]